MKSKVLESILENKIIAIIRKVDTDKLIQTVEALKEGGIKLIEVTFDQSGEFSVEYTSEQIKLIHDTYGDKLYIGAGTVMTVKQVELAYKAGAKYIISPNVNQEVIEKTVELGMISIPGALTPTEIETAHRFGADVVKMFPAGEIGIGYIKAVIAPLNHIKIMAVGGVNEENLKQFLDLGILGVGVGSNIVRKDLISKGKFNEITKLALKYTEQTNK